MATEYRYGGIGQFGESAVLRIIVGKSGRITDIPLTATELARLTEDAAATLRKILQSGRRP